MFALHEEKIVYHGLNLCVCFNCLFIIASKQELLY